MSTLIAVYPDRDTAEESAHEVRAAEGVRPVAVRVGSADDSRTALVAEMEAEAAESWGSGMFGLVTAEMMRGAVVFGTLGVAIGAVLGLPLGLFLYDPGVSALTRLGFGALVGVLFGGVVGALLGGGMAMKSPEERLAAERGVTVAVDDLDAETDPVVEELLTAHAPIRIDRFVDGRRVDTPTTEGPSGVQETFAEFRANTSDPSRR